MNAMLRTLKLLPSRLVVLSFLFVLSAADANAGGRYAILVGASNYLAIEPLHNPINDVTAVARSLEEAAFTVEIVLDPTSLEATDRLLSFLRGVFEESQSTEIEALLFFFAGHGVQHRGENFLLPVDFSMPLLQSGGAEDYLSRLETALWENTFNINNLVDSFNVIEADSYIFIFDACRTSPFDGVVLSDGLSEVVAGPDNYIVFSAAPGRAALDGSGANSPFSQSLAARIPFQGMPIEVMMQGVRRDVYRETDGYQLPWDASSLMHPFSFIPLGAFGEREPLEDVSEQESQLWEFVVQSGFTAQALRRYLIIFPNGRHADAARLRLEGLE
ncbi:caspase family protein [Gymnodinialimonas sp. 2305UL16-5]|uniref:caspase family protein n=1 Tax=Gymnodinialimonas mytili TaxID=3126503 RepID=UPI0030A2C3A2